MSDTKTVPVELIERIESILDDAADHMPHAEDVLEELQAIQADTRPTELDAHFQDSLDALDNLAPPQAPVSEIPTGAIENGREFMRRLEDHYQFGSGGVSLYACPEWAELKRCFEHLAEHCQTEPQAPVSGLQEYLGIVNPVIEDSDSGPIVIDKKTERWGKVVFVDDLQTTQPPTAELLALPEAIKEHTRRGAGAELFKVADELQAALDKMPGSGWLDIKDAPKEELVLVAFLEPFFGTFTTEVDAGYYDGHSGKWRFNLTDREIVGGGVTHWMPLPAPPSGESG